MSDASVRSDHTDHTALDVRTGLKLAGGKIGDQGVAGRFSGSRSSQ
jgi:hypothetical protein